MGIIKGICISKERGTEKHEVAEAGFVKDWGIQGDAHAGKWHRQVSLLSFEKIEEFRTKGADVAFGAFGENLIVETETNSRIFRSVRDFAAERCCLR